MKYDKGYLARQAEKYGFVRDTLEKVFRLKEILEYINRNSFLKELLVLKGGTAINLTLFDLPRLSVDIDLDYTANNRRDEMLAARDVIRADLEKYIRSQQYSFTVRQHHSLDSYSLVYENTGGNSDTIKIEINYSLRTHILPYEIRSILADVLEKKSLIKILAPVELYASKINALLNRAAARDLYDVSQMIRSGIINPEDFIVLKKCTVFYAAISATPINKNFSQDMFDSITDYSIRTELLPVLRTGDQFFADEAKKQVNEFLQALMVLSDKERAFIDRFELKDYHPELLFDDEAIIGRLQRHPMALWKVRTNPSN